MCALHNAPREGILMSGVLRARRRSTPNRMFSEEWFKSVRENRDLARRYKDRTLVRRTYIALAVGQTAYIADEVVLSPIASLVKRAGSSLRYMASIIGV